MKYYKIKEDKNFVPASSLLYTMLTKVHIMAREREREKCAQCAFIINSIVSNSVVYFSTTSFYLLCVLYVAA